ncbi:hypothetical protein KC19_8G080900, partial [Ceratodon purpureus]
MIAVRTTPPCSELSRCVLTSSFSGDRFFGTPACPTTEKKCTPLRSAHQARPLGQLILWRRPRPHWGPHPSDPPSFFFPLP